METSPNIPFCGSKNLVYKLTKIALTLFGLSSIVILGIGRLDPRTECLKSGHGEPTACELKLFRS